MKIFKPNALDIPTVVGNTFRQLYKLMNHRLIFLLLIILTSCSDSREYKIKFDDVERLGEGDKIFIRGVGQVKDISVDENKKFLVTISITKDIKVTVGSKFILQSDVLGSQHLEIELADMNNELVKPGQLQMGEIRGRDTTGLRKLTQEECDSMIQANPGGQIADSIFKVLRTVYKDKKKRGE